MNPEDKQQVLNDTRELAQMLLEQLGFSPAPYPWEMLDTVLAQIATDFPKAKQHPHDASTIIQFGDDLSALDAISTWTRIISHIDPQSVPEDARGPLIAKILPDAYWTAEEWYQQHRLG